MINESLTPPRRMVFIDGLRGLAALAIVFTHCGELFHVTAMHGGWFSEFLANLRFYFIESVQVFFALSGFVIAYVLRDARLTPPAFARFFLRRTIRLDPPYWICIALNCVVLTLLAGHGQRAAALPSLQVVLAHLFYLQDILHFGEPINHVYWTLCIEIQMYLAFGAMICLLQAMRIPYRPTLALGLIVLLGWPMGWFRSPPFRFFLEQEYCFLTGAVAWWITECAIPRWMMIAIAGAMLAASVSRVGDYHIWVTFTVGILLVTAGIRGTLYTWLASKPLQFAGGLSYGLYLVHDPVIRLIVPIQRWLGFTTTPGEFITLLIAYLGTISLAYALHRYVEIPTIQLSHRLRLPKNSHG